MHVNVMTIYKELSVKDLNVMRKVLFIPIILCTALYPAMAIIGGTSF